MTPPQDVLGSEWKYLMLFDACRYDAFERCYQDFFTGSLEARRSPAIYTLEWLVKTFPEHYDDIIYVSPIFFCNSIRPVKRWGSEFYGGDHFYRVIDAWKTAWDEEYGTATPWNINKIVRKLMLAYPEKRFVIHYFQPHAPYLSLRPTTLLKKKNEEIAKAQSGNMTLGTKKILTRRFSAIYHKMFGTVALWKLIRFLGVEPASDQEEAWQKVGTEGLKELYEKNLRAVMLCAREIIPHMHGKVIITADHGELLGEHGFYGHGIPKPRLPELTTVPWFHVE